MSSAKIGYAKRPDAPGLNLMSHLVTCVYRPTPIFPYYRPPIPSSTQVLLRFYRWSFRSRLLLAVRSESGNSSGFSFPASTLHLSLLAPDSGLLFGQNLSLLADLQ